MLLFSKLAAIPCLRCLWMHHHVCSLSSLRKPGVRCAVGSAAVWQFPGAVGDRNIEKPRVSLLSLAESSSVGWRAGGIPTLRRGVMIRR